MRPTLIPGEVNSEVYELQNLKKLEQDNQKKSNLVQINELLDSNEDNFKLNFHKSERYIKKTDIQVIITLIMQQGEEAGISYENTKILRRNLDMKINSINDLR